MTVKTQKETNLPEGVTKDMIANWKAEFGEKKVKVARLEDDENVFEPMEIVIRRPGRREMAMFEKFIDRDPDKAKEIVLKACVLSRKDEILANDDMFLHAFNAVSNLMPVAKAELKNV